MVITFKGVKRGTGPLRKKNRTKINGKRKM